jgi:hypothetical protein
VMTGVALFAWAVLAEGSMTSSSGLLVSLFECDACCSGVKDEANWVGQSVIGRISGSSLVLIIFFL